jgi:CspA family cold shock protein
MSTGKIKFFNDTKGYGFIIPNEPLPEPEIFVHISGLLDKVHENDEVTFDLKEGKNGLNAINVKIA